MARVLITRVLMRFRRFSKNKTEMVWIEAQARHSLATL